MKTVNLIPAARRESKRRHALRKVCVVACCAYGALLTCAVGVAIFGFGGEGVEPLTKRVANTEAEIERYQQQAEAARVELATAKATIEANRTVAEQADWSILLALLANTTADDVVLRLVAVAPPANAPVPIPTNSKASSPQPTPAAPEAALDLTGVGKSQLAVSQFVLRLEQTGLFSKVTLLDTGREQFVNSNVIAFRLQCQFGEPPSSRQPVSRELTASAGAGGSIR